MTIKIKNKIVEEKPISKISINDNDLHIVGDTSAALLSLEKDEELGYLGPIKMVLFDSKSSNSFDVVCFYVWTCLCHVTIGITGFVTLKPILAKLVNAPAELTNLDMHILFCCVGYQMLIAEAILCLNYYNGCAPPLRKTHKRTAHYILEIVGSIFALLGTTLAMVSEQFELKSLHAVYGTIAATLTLVGLLNGFCASKMRRFTFWKAFHSCFGGPAFIFSTIAFITAIIGKSDVRFELEALSETYQEDTNIDYDLFNTTLNNTFTTETFEITDSMPTTTDIVIIPTSPPKAISYLLVGCSCFYTFGIVFMPYAKMCNFWSKQIL